MNIFENIRQDLEEKDFHEIQTSEDFLEKYFSTFNRNKYDEALKVEGEIFWVSALNLNSKLKIQQNIPPTQVVVVIKDKKPYLYALNLKKKIEIINNGNQNIVNICKTKKQAKYMYNKNAEEIYSELEKEMKRIESVKEKIFSSAFNNR